MPQTTEYPQPAQRRRRTGATAIASAVAGAIAAMSLLVVTSSRAAFFATTSNGQSNFTAGTVALGEDASGSVLFTVPNMKPGDVETKCINVTYTGTLPSDVHLYGVVDGTGLATYLTTTVDVGTGAAGGASLSCAGFTGPSNIYNGTLAGFGADHTNYADGATGFDGAINPTTRSYRVTVTLQDNNLAQGLTASTTLTWEAQNI